LDFGEKVDIFTRLHILSHARVVGVFVVATLLALAASFALPEQTSTDFARYYAPRAREFLAGSGLLDPNGQLYTRYPPGYPLILVGVLAGADALNVSERALLIVVASVGMGASAVLLYATAARVFGQNRALITAGAWATYPFALWTISGGQIEAIYMPFFFAAIYVFMRVFFTPAPPRAPLFGLSGILVGMAMLIRPAALGVGMILALFALSRRQIAGAAALVAANGLIIALWLIPVYMQNGVVIPLSTGGVLSVIDGVTFAVRASSEREAVTLPASVIALQRRILDGVQTADESASWLGIVAAELRADPAAALQLGAIKAGRAWYATDSRRYETLSALIQIVYLALIGAAAWRILRGHAPPNAKRLLALVVALMVYGWLTTIAVLSILRYMLPTMGLLFCLLPALFVRASHRDAATDNLA